MKNSLRSFAALCGILATVAPAFAAQEAVTNPIGVMNFTIPAGTGTTRTVSTLSLPLHDTATAAGQMVGRITGVTATTLSNASGNWTAGQLSVAATPHILRVTSGNATGRTFLISTTTPNTATTLTIDASDALDTDLTTLGITANATTGDTYEIVPCDTLASVFGTPATLGVLGGATAAAADTVTLLDGVTPKTYFYSTTLGRWTRQALGSPDASNTPIRPDAGLNYSRLGNSAITFSLFGSVPSTSRKSVIRNSGPTYLAMGWPIDLTLTQLAIQTIPTWTTGANANVADTVQVFISGLWRTYWFDGTNWRRQALGSPISDSQVIPAGSNVILNQRGTSTGISLLAQIKPY